MTQGASTKERLERLSQAIRQACTPAAWSHGVQLSRSGGVQFESGDDEELIYRVTVDGRAISPTVSLFLDDEDWVCDCTPREIACEHIAAAVIVSCQPPKSQESPEPPTEGVGRVGYRFRRSRRGLVIERVMVTEAGDGELPHRVVAVTRRGEGGPRLLVDKADVAVERLLERESDNYVPSARMPQLLKALASCVDVRLDGEAVETSSLPVGPVIRLEDDASGMRLILGRDASIDEVFTNGVALCRETLRPVGQRGLTVEEVRRYTTGERFGPHQFARLMQEVIPDLRQRIRVEVRAQRLPETVRAALRVVCEVRRDGDELVVLPVLEYGEPALARVERGELCLLGESIPQRDSREEARLERDVRSGLGVRLGVEARLRGEEAIALASRLSSMGGVEIRGSGHRDFRLLAPLRPRVDYAGGSLDVWFESGASEGGRAQRISGAHVLAAYREGDSLLGLEEGGFAPLPRGWLESHAGVLADVLAGLEHGASPGAALAPDVKQLYQALDETVPEALDNLVAAWDSNALVTAPPLPTDLDATLRSYQQTGVDWLAAHRQRGTGAMLADDMGLGKTLQALCGVQGRVLVVCPTSVLHSWRSQAARFRPKLRICVYHGPGRTLDEEADLTVTTYALLRLDVERLAAIGWEQVILDEAQSIKNPDSQVARAAFRLRACVRMTLSGTPVENRLEELWSQMHFLNPGLLGGRRDFQDRYVRPIAGGDTRITERLRDRIQPFVLRRLKRDVAPELPARTDGVLRCSLGEREREVYDALAAATREDVVARLRDGGSPLQALEALLRLRQAACHIGLIPGQEAETSAKVDLLITRVAGLVESGHKVLIFSQWTSLLDRVEPHLEGRGVDFSRLDGGTRDRASVVEEFQSEVGPPVLLISLKAGGTGLTLTAADHVFLLDPWWNPAVEEQAADRTHRIGQERPVFVHRLVAEGTVEERILALQERKRELSDSVLSATGAASGLTAAELMELLVE